MTYRQVVFRPLSISPLSVANSPGRRLPIFSRCLILGPHLPCPPPPPRLPPDGLGRGPAAPRSLPQPRQRDPRPGRPRNFRGATPPAPAPPPRPPVRGASAELTIKRRAATAAPLPSEASGRAGKVAAGRGSPPPPPPQPFPALPAARRAPPAAAAR